MLEGWLQGNLNFSASAEATDEPQDSRPSLEQTRLHLPTPIDARSGTPPSGEHGTAVCTAREGAGTGLEPTPDPHTRPGPGQDGYRNGGAGGLQDFGGGCFDGPSRCGVCIGSLAVGTLEPGLASAARVVRAHYNPGDRRRWLLRSSGLQRRIVARLEGYNGAGRAPFLARAPPGRQTQQSQER